MFISKISNPLRLFLGALFVAGIGGSAAYFSINQTRERTGAIHVIDENDVTNLIQISSPGPNQQITSPLTIEGKARGSWFFEADFPVRLLDENGNLLAQGIAMTRSDWMTDEFVPFGAELRFDAADTKRGTLILQKDNPSGLAEHNQELRIPVVFQDTETMTVKVFFNNKDEDPEYSGDKVFATERQVSKTRAVARAALEELLKGPTEREKSDGFYTNINPGVAIRSLRIVNGAAEVDFDRQLEFQVGGSARVSAIRAQITQTLEQFPTVEKVIISIEGRTEDILQP